MGWLSGREVVGKSCSVSNAPAEVAIVEKSTRNPTLLVPRGGVGIMSLLGVIWFKSLLFPPFLPNVAMDNSEREGDT